MDLNSLSEPVLVQGTAIIVAIVSLIGTIVTSYLAYREKTRSKVSEAEKAAKEEAAREKEEAEKAKKALEEERRAQELTALKAELASLKSDLTHTNTQAGQNLNRSDKQYNKIVSRIQDNEDSIAKITQVLAKNARTYSGLMLINEQTMAKLRHLVQVEQHNLTLTKGVADLIEELTQVMALMSDDGIPEHTAHIKDLMEVMNHVTEAKAAFLDSMLEDSMGNMIEATPSPKPMTGTTSENLDLLLTDILPGGRPNTVDREFDDLLMEMGGGDPQV